MATITICCNNRELNGSKVACTSTCCTVADVKAAACSDLSLSKLELRDKFLHVTATNKGNEVSCYDLKRDFLPEDAAVKTQNVFVVVGWRKPDKYPAVLFYVANIIDYVRLLFLYLALMTDGPVYDFLRPILGSNGRYFALLYAFSYFLDIFDGIAARALGQCSHLGYYLDMVIDRISSVLALHTAARMLLGGEVALPFVPGGEGTTMVFVAFLYVCAVMVEVVAHGVVCYCSEVLNVHQKLLGFDYSVVRLYLDSKVFLGIGCISYEAFTLGIICDMPLLVGISAPGFVFRAVANLFRLYAAATLKAEGKDE